MMQTRVSRLQHQWDMRAAGNFIFGGAGSGLIAVSAAGAVAGSPEAARLPMAAGVVSIGLGLTLVWLEIGKPWRALNLFFHPQTSWMTREGIVACPLLLAAAAGAWYAQPAVMVIAGVLALGFLYCQARILRASKGIPAWRQPEIVPFIFATGLAEGAGLYAVAGSQSTAVACFVAAAILLREAAWGAYVQGLAQSGAPAAILDVLSSREIKAFRLLQAAALLVLVLSLPPGVKAGIALAGLLAAVSGWGMKAVIITRAAFTQGPAIPFIPVRGRGTGRIVAR